MIKDKYTYQDLVDLLRFLNSKDGCPWDIVQTHQSILDNLIEETYEAKQAIEQNDIDNMIEELGDCLMQPLFHGIIAKRNGTFDIDDIIDALAKKLVYRHSHIFAEQNVKYNAEQALDNWQSKKDKTPYQSMTNLPMDLPIDIKIKKLYRYLDKQNIQCDKLKTELKNHLQSLDAINTKINTTIKDMIQLLE